MLKAIIIDDELHCQQTLAMQLKALRAEVEILEQCRSAKQGIEAILKHDPDLVFLDIQMPVMNGFEMLKLIPGINFKVVFTTSFDQYALRAIRFSALDYLLKPVSPHDLALSVKRAQEQIYKPHAEQSKCCLKTSMESLWVLIRLPFLLPKDLNYYLLTR